MKELSKYNVAGYCRLSKDDDVRGGESSSIKSQKDIIEQYTKDKGWQIFNFYIDDGWSGVNFERPAFKRMISDIEDGKVNLVVTKDLSRLGRNYILAGQYTEIYFPSKGVRYIALNDNVDTLNNEYSIAPFVNILNEMYAKDISKKVRSALRAKKIKGEFTSGFAPFGYQKDPQNKNRLIVEDKGAVIVRRIFEMAKEDLGSVKICNVLNDEGVPTPLNHRKKLLYGIEPASDRWGSATVISILRNRIYMGDMVQGIYEHSKFNKETVKRRPKEDWFITPNTHEPLVAADTWEYVQKTISARKHPIKSNIIQFFAGFVKCEDCDRTMGYARRYNIEYYCCSTYRRYGNKYCTCHYIRKDVLEQAVLDDIRKYSKLAKDKTFELAERLREQTNEEDTIQIKTLDTEAQKLAIREKEIDVVLKSLYEDNVSGKLSDDRFTKFLASYEKEQADVKLKVEDLLKKKNRIMTRQKDTDSWIKLIRNYTNIKKLDRTVLSELVDKIIIGEARVADGQKVTDITIYYRFVGAVS